MLNSHILCVIRDIYQITHIRRFCKTMFKDVLLALSTKAPDATNARKDWNDALWQDDSTVDSMSNATATPRSNRIRFGGRLRAPAHMDNAAARIPDDQ